MNVWLLYHDTDYDDILIGIYETKELAFSAQDRFESERKESRTWLEKKQVGIDFWNFTE